MICSLWDVMGIFLKGGFTLSDGLYAEKLICRVGRIRMHTNCPGKGKILYCIAYISGLPCLSAHGHHPKAEIAWILSLDSFLKRRLGSIREKPLLTCC